eukprot:TRINITY_DN61842_c0_g3_i1.p2 TRINITY_DN61842_c0_g3~~TRINITY_DN61842_c0_g3_i1.p2  ORF type:complete len:179 (-),score=5.60 TRINITY_DN61842_c0_g3_i1:626-1162(-)
MLSASQLFFVLVLGNWVHIGLAVGLESTLVDGAENSDSTHTCEVYRVQYRDSTCAGDPYTTHKFRQKECYHNGKNGVSLLHSGHPWSMQCFLPNTPDTSPAVVVLYDWSDNECNNLVTRRTIEMDTCRPCYSMDAYGVQQTYCKYHCRCRGARVFPDPLDNPATHPDPVDAIDPNNAD